MLEEYKYKTELHAHTKPCSSCSHIPPEEMIEVYKNAGYSSVAITNHLMYNEDVAVNDPQKYLKDFHKCADLGKNCGISVILGAEIRFKGNCNDYLIYGIEEDEIEKINKLLCTDIDTFYKEYKNDRNVIIQAHPFRDGLFRADVGSLDGIEVFNLHPKHNSRIGVAAKYAKENDMIVTCGSDFHDHGSGALCSVLTKEPVTSSVMLADVLKSRDYIFEISGMKVLPY